MKNLLVSALVVGALACPVVYANEEATVAQPAAEGQAEPAKQPHKKHHGKKKRHQGKKKHHGKKHHKQHAKKHHKHHAKPKQVAEEETPAEKKIEEETELTNR
jgi:ABC-type nickel/cobalt efflux system permease component RcnA